MVLGKVTSIMMSVGVGLMLLGCGSGSDDDTAQPAGEDIQTPADGNNTGSENNNTNEDNTTDPIVVGYTAGDGVIIETKSDGTKLAWVNATGTACLIYRIAQRGGTILGGGTAHCEGLEHGGITTWRMPTEEEAVYLMANVSTTGEERIIYPDDNPNCQFMATSTDGRYVYTTNNPNTGAFTDADRGTAGIRCVAEQ